MKVKKTTLHFGIDTKHFKNWSFENADQNNYSCNLYIFSVYSLNPEIFISSTFFPLSITCAIPIMKRPDDSLCLFEV